MCFRHYKKVNIVSFHYHSKLFRFRWASQILYIKVCYVEIGSIWYVDGVCASGGGGVGFGCGDKSFKPVSSCCVCVGGGDVVLHIVTPGSSSPPPRQEGSPRGRLA